MKLKNLKTLLRNEKQHCKYNNFFFWLVFLIVKVVVLQDTPKIKMFYIQLPYSVVNKENQIKLNLQKNYGASQYFNKLPYLSNTGHPVFRNSIIDTLNSCADLRKYLVATSDYGQNIQENINSVVTDGKFNDALIRHVLDEKNKGVLDTSTPLCATFKDTKNFYLQNPNIGNIISQVNANQIGEKGVRELFARAEDEKIRRLEALKRPDNEDGGQGDYGSNGPPVPLLPPLPRQTLPSPPAFSTPRLPPTLDDLLDSEGGFFGTGSLNDVRNDLWDDVKLQTDYNKTLTPLTDNAENTIEIIPKVREKTKPEEITFSDELSKLFPEANRKIAEQEEKVNDLPLNNLENFFSKIDKGEIPKELKFFVGGLNNEFENRLRSLGISTTQTIFWIFFSRIFV